MPSAIDTALQQGRYLDAIRLLPSEEWRSRTPEDQVRLIELLSYTGQRARARSEAARLYEMAASRSLLSRCELVISEQLEDDGDLLAAQRFARQALENAEEAKDSRMIALASAQVLQILVQSGHLEGCATFAAQCRKHTLRAGDPHLRAQVHAQLGCVEGQLGRLELALKHFGLAESICRISGVVHLGLSARIALDSSSTHFLAGHVDKALRLAESGIDAAQRAGWTKGVFIAANNLATLHIWRGAVKFAEKYVAVAESQHFHCATYQISLLETKAQILLCTGHLSEAVRLLLTGQSGWRPATVWAALALRETLIRAFLSIECWDEAIKESDEALALADKLNHESFAQLFRQFRAEALLARGDDVQTSTLPLSPSHRTSLLELGGYFGMLSRGLRRHGAIGRAEACISTAVRAYSSSGPQFAERDAAKRCEELAALIVPGKGLHIDGLGALFDFAGHPNLIGYEALALLERAACSQAAALVAGDRPRLRVIRTFGWPESEVIAAIAGSKIDTEMLTLGKHHDEALHLVVKLSANLDARCTYVTIRKMVQHALELGAFRRAEKERAALWPSDTLEGDPESIWASEEMTELLGIARRIAPHQVIVLLTGETGTGKEMLARAIHRASDRADGVFLPFNCSAVPRDMLESQLFGYRKGAFTGADVAFPGIVRSAEGGTLFLDEIGDVGLDLQAKLLRFLESYEIHPLGETQPFTVNVRVIAATNAPLEQLVGEGRFREDLFYRLNGIRLNLPPLRQRREEIPPLLQYYLRKHSEEMLKGSLSLTDETLEYLLLYSWPGNVRQLANEVRRMVAMAEPGGRITPALLSSEIQASRRTLAARPEDPAEVRVRIDQTLPGAIEALEQLMVQRALERSQGRLEEAARLLGISRKGLFLKRRRWGLARS